MLLDNADGRIQIWSLNNSSQQFSQYTFGPYAGFTATGLSVGTDNTTHVLWNSTSGTVIIWNYSTSNGSHTFGQYGPLAGWTAKAIADGTDGFQRILWGNTNGLLCIWNLNNSTGASAAQSTYGPYGGWAATSLSVGPDNEAHILLDNVSGGESLWSVSPSGKQDSVQQPVSLGTVSGTGAAFGYTGDDLRAWKQNSAGTRTYFLYDGSDPVAEMDASGTIQAINTFGANGLVSRHTTATGSTTFYTFDERGNVSQRVNSAGQVLSTDLYDAFGSRTSTTPGAQPDPWGYAAQSGYYTDSETGLLLLTHRYYDPQQGRFVTRDPISYNGGINLYSYVQNDPGNRWDPDGHGGDGRDDDVIESEQETIAGLEAIAEGAGEAIKYLGDAANDAIDNISDDLSPQDKGNLAHGQPFQDYIQGQYPGSTFNFPEPNEHGPDALLDKGAGNLFDPDWDFAELKKNSPEEIARGKRALNGFSRRGYSGRGQLFTYTITTDSSGNTTFTYGPHPPACQGKLDF